MSRRPGAAGGFTLLELLVAITLLGVLMAALFGALRLGARVWETGEARLDESARLQVVQGFLRRQLGQAMPVANLADDPAAVLRFAGEPDRLRFVGLLPEHLDAGAYRMELVVREPAQAGTPGDLVIRWRALNLTGEADPPPNTEERVLIERVERLEIAYFGASAADPEPRWWRQWRRQSSLPTLIRLRVRFEEGDGRAWPELMVAPMIDLAPPSEP
jgi:general secretion pathway protein J